MAGIGGRNAPGEAAPEELYADIEDGLLLTDLMGFGVNLTTGDFSRGAQGFRIERGGIAAPSLRMRRLTVSGL